MHRTLFIGTVATVFVFAAMAGETAAQKADSEVKKFTYRKTPQTDLEIYVHFPPGWKQSDKRPAIVFFFGGGWTSGTVKQFQPQCEYLASRGMVAARADYRVKSRHKVNPDSCVEDCKNAVRWLRKNAEMLGIDPKRIAAGGGSAGGHTAASTAIVPGFEGNGDTKVSSKPNLLVLYNPALDVVEILKKRGAPELAEKLSPNQHLNKDAPPAIILFGTNDRLLKGAEDYLVKAKKLKVDAELYVAKGQRHGFFNRPPWMAHTLFVVDRFLTKHGYLQGKPTIDVPKGPRMKLSDSSSS